MARIDFSDIGSDTEQWAREVVGLATGEDPVKAEIEYQARDPSDIDIVRGFDFKLTRQNGGGGQSHLAAVQEPDPGDIVTAITWRNRDDQPILTISGLSKTWNEVETALRDQDSSVRYEFLVSLMNGTGTILGGSARDIIEVGAGGTATINAGGSDDVAYVWHAKNLSYDGGAGLNDRLDFDVRFGGAPTPVTGAVVNLTTHKGTNPYGGTITNITGVEQVFGTSKADQLTGDSADNRLDGGFSGNDQLKGEGGDDILTLSLLAAATVTADGGTGADAVTLDISFAPSDTTPATSVLDLNVPANSTGVFDKATITTCETINAGDYSIRFDQPNLGVEIRGRGVGETLRSGWGADTLLGNGGDDTLTGDSGIDRLDGGAGDDTLDSSLSSNVFGGVTDAGADRLDGGAGTDLAVISRVVATKAITLDLSNPNVQRTLADGTSLIRIERLDMLTGSGNDRLTGGDRADRLETTRGKDTLDGGGGTDRLIGGDGNDTYRVDSRKDAVVEFSGTESGTDTVFATASFTLSAEVEKLTLSGGKAIDGTGNALANTITGNSRANTLSGDLGNDTLRGGGGDDRFVFDTAPNATSNLDHIKDFKAADDVLRLENTGAGLFKKLDKGTLDAEAFALVNSGGAKVDRDVHILYDKGEGRLYYDANGGTDAGRVLFAVLDNHAALTHLDIVGI